MSFSRSLCSGLPDAYAETKNALARQALVPMTVRQGRKDNGKPTRFRPERVASTRSGGH
jgi:hypothetical protein